MTAKKDQNLSRSEALAKAWKLRKDYKGYDKTKGSAFNSWRAITYTEKGAKAGFPESWRVFDNFFKDVQGDWARGRVVCRYNTKEPHGPQNSYWTDKGHENSGKLIRFTYKGEEKTLLEWSAQLGLNYQGVRQRYFRGKDLSTEEILFGKSRKIRTPHERNKAFRTLRMLGAYRLRDKRKGHHNDLTIDYFRELISSGCIYCGDTDRVGLDRIDNNIGHSKDNVVPCCYSCNTARNNNFSYDEMLVIGKSIRQVKEARRHEDK